MRGLTTLCANKRLARRLRLRHTQEQLRRGQRAWESPDILPWQAWLLRLWEARADTKEVLLSDRQANVLWQQVIEGSAHKHSLLQASAVAAQAAAAWQRLQQYRVPIFPDGTALNKDTAAFRDWSDTFRSICRRNNWIDHASLVDTLLPGIAGARDIGAGELVLAGFDRLTPEQALLCEALRNSGVTVRVDPINDRNESAQVADFADIDEEIRAAAIWARQCIEADPACVVGIIAPDLRRLRTRLHRILEDTLAPGNLYYPNADITLPFSISTGQPLADYPLIHVIFSLLSLGGKMPLNLDNLGVLLRTPFIRGHQTEYSQRALLDERLRSRGQLTISWDDLAHLIGSKTPGVPILGGILRELRILIEELPARQSPEAWAAGFTRFLEVLGWPGDRPLDSAEYQQAQAWNAALDKLVSLRVVRAQMTRAEALAHLRRIAEDSFQPETAETPIQVLDPQGAAAMAFDGIWMLGLSEEAWPPRHRPNPFIPIALQKQYGMPGADAELALEQAEALQAALVRSTPHIILSHARNEADRPLLASPLLQGLEPAPEIQMPPAGSANTSVLGEPAAQPFLATTYDQVIFRSRTAATLETIVDSIAPPVAGDQRGGTALFRDQSQCPFRAFARHRLQARQPEQADIGLDAKARGILLHRLMENAWSRLQNQETLTAMTDEQRKTLAETLARDVIRESRKYNPLFLNERFAAMERARLARILDEWLQLELQRAPFSVVDMEAEMHGAIAGVEFSARLDRVDELEDGRRVIIDYKSGQASANAWSGERPREPQLPLYAVSYPEPVAALAYARLKRGKDFGFHGLADAEGILPNTMAFAQDRLAKKLLDGADQPEASPEWDELFNRWRDVLENLADEFSRGVASVTPQPRACDWCEQQPFCRIHEVNAQLTEQERDD